MEGQGAKTYQEMRVWGAARAVKQALYDLADTDAFLKEERLRNQLREAAASAVSHIGEGYGRFDPRDHARFLKMGRASLIECQNHLVDAVDRRVITETIRQEHDLKIQGVLRGLTPLISYLQSPQARTNVERIKRKRAQRRKRKGGNDEPGTQNS
jgi:four helix bundle protein